MLSERNVLGDNTLINFKEFLSSWLIKREHFEGRDLETFLEDSIDNLSGISVCDSVRLYYTYCAVVENSSGRLLLLEEEIGLAFPAGA